MFDQLIYRHQNNLTETDWQIYQVIKESPTAHRQTIQELAGTAHVSTTTIYRFCKKLGLSGYSELTALLKHYRTSSNDLPDQELREYYHSVIRYIDTYPSDELFLQLKQTEILYILARSVTELRIAREMMRIFMPMGKIIIILSSHEALVHHLPHLQDKVLFCIDIDYQDSLPPQWVNYLHVKPVYFVLLSDRQQETQYYDELILLPSPRDLQVGLKSHTHYMMALEVLYLKYMLT